MVIFTEIVGEWLKDDGVVDAVFEEPTKIASS